MPLPAIETVLALDAAGLLRRRQNRPVAGAAAQVARQRLLRLLTLVFPAVLLQTEHRHYKSRRAKTALRAVAIDHRLLHAVQLAMVFQILHRDQLFAVQRADERQAGIDAAVAQLSAFRLGQYDGASAAVTGSTAFFGAATAQVAAQIVQHRGVGIERAFTF